MTEKDRLKISTAKAFKSARPSLKRFFDSFAKEAKAAELDDMILTGGPMEKTILIPTDDPSVDIFVSVQVYAFRMKRSPYGWVRE